VIVHEAPLVDAVFEHEEEQDDDPVPQDAQVAAEYDYDVPRVNEVK